MGHAAARDVAEGLAASPKTLPAKYFYDTRGSQLYEQICTLPEYYPYRAERDILATYAADIYTAIGHVPLVEFGSGNATKTRYLLSVYERARRPFLYCPVDISRTILEETAQKLLAEYAYLSVHAIHADFAGDPGVIRTLHLEKKALAFLGSHHVAPNLLFDPGVNEAEALAGVTHRKVVHPASQDRIDQFDHPTHRLGSEASEDLPQLRQQRRALLELGRVLGPQCSAERADAAEVKSQEAEALASVQFDGSALLFIDLDL
jgi:hypothetical protein